MSCCHCHYHHCRCRRPYGFGLFLLDVILTVLTGGVWLIVIFFREMRRR